MARLRAYVEEELVPRPEVERVVLIGSLARGDWSARSDADLVLLVDRSAERGPFRGAAYAPNMSLGVPVDVLVYTPKEVRSWPRRFRTETDRDVVLPVRAEAASGGVQSPGVPCHPHPVSRYSPGPHSSTHREGWRDTAR